MNSIENIKDQKPKEVTEAHRAWLTAAPLGQLYSAYRGLVAHVGEQMRYALEEHESGEPIQSTRRAHAIMLEYPERLRLVSAEIARRVGGISSANDKRSDGGTPFTPAPCSTFPEGIEETWRADAAEQGIVELQRENEKHLALPLRMGGALHWPRLIEWIAARFAL